MGQCSSDADCIVNDEYGGGLECVDANSTFIEEHHLPQGTKVCLWKKWHGRDTRAKCQGEHVWYGDHLGSHDGGGRKSSAK